MNFEIDGKQAYAFTGGRTLDPSKPSVMFVHGAAMDHTVWALPTRYFVRHGYNVLSVDLPGHGRSEGPPAATLSDAADFLVKPLNPLGNLLQIRCHRRDNQQRIESLELDEPQRTGKRIRLTVAKDTV